MRVRPTSALGRKVIDAGIARFGDVPRPVQRLEQSDVIVYVQTATQHAIGSSEGCSSSWARGGNNRYLHVTVGSLHHLDVLVALLGHELQHAAEVADAPSVLTAGEFAALYRRIGVPSGAGRYDSAAALSAGQTVRAELRGRHAEVRVASHAPAGEDALLDGGSIAMP